MYFFIDLLFRSTNGVYGISSSTWIFTSTWATLWRGNVCIVHCTFYGRNEASTHFFLQLLVEVWYTFCLGFYITCCPDYNSKCFAWIYIMYNCVIHTGISYQTNNMWPVVRIQVESTVIFGVRAVIRNVCCVLSIPVKCGILFHGNLYHLEATGEKESINKPNTEGKVSVSTVYFNILLTIMIDLYQHNEHLPNVCYSPFTCRSCTCNSIILSMLLLAEFSNMHQSFHCSRAPYIHNRRNSSMLIRACIQ